MQPMFSALRGKSFIKTLLGCHLIFIYTKQMKGEMIKNNKRKDSASGLLKIFAGRCLFVMNRCISTLVQVHCLHHSSGRWHF